jgi:DNA-binding MarR family transcriptional regulator
MDRPLFHLLLHSADILDGQLEQSLAPLGISAAQGRVLEAVARLGVPSQQQLAQALRVAAPSLSVMLDRLCTRGLLRRAPDPQDGRTRRIFLTDRGHSSVAQVRGAWAEVEARLRATLADTEAARAVLLAIRNGLGGRSPDFGDGA